MKVRDVMTSPAIRIHPEEPVSVAARRLEHYNIGALPVCGSDGKVCGMVTDRDIVVRCLAAERRPENTTVEQVMTGRVLTVDAETSLADAAKLMGEQQIRRLPVVQSGKLCGMLSLGDLAGAWEECDTAAALNGISSPISRR